MSIKVTIENGFAEVGAGEWLMSHAQPTAFSGKAQRLARRAWRLKDRAHLNLVATDGSAHCGDRTRPFLTHIPCAAALGVISSKVLVAPNSARKRDYILRTIPMSLAHAKCVSEFTEEWVVTATRSRTKRITLEESQTLSVRPDAAVAWTCKAPTGSCPRISIWDVLLPRMPKDLLLTFYGPGAVWIEGSAPNEKPIARRAHVI